MSLVQGASSIVRRACHLQPSPERRILGLLFVPSCGIDGRCSQRGRKGQENAEARS